MDLLGRHIREVVESATRGVRCVNVQIATAEAYVGVVGESLWWGRQLVGDALPMMRLEKLLGSSERASCAYVITPIDAKKGSSFPSTLMFFFTI